MHRFLIHEKMFPLDTIGIYWDPINSTTKINYYKIAFVNRNKQLDVCFITKTMAKIDLLRQQLIEYFIKSGENNSCSTSS